MLFEQKVWAEPLEKYARALGVTISLFDRVGERRGLTSPGPIGEYLERQGFWSPEGNGTTLDRAAAQACTATGQGLFAVEYDLFAHLTVPVVIDGEVMAVFVLGWVPEHFVDPVACDKFAKKSRASAMDVWQIMRMQQPVTRTKLETYGRLLETFSVPLLRQLLSTVDDRRRMEQSLVLNEAIASFSAASSERALSQALFTALRAMFPLANFELRLPNSAGGEPLRYRDQPVPEPAAETRADQLTIKVPSANRLQFGVIEITSFAGRCTEAEAQTVHSLAAHLGGALQRKALIDDLRKERAALSAANDELTHLHKMKDEFLATVSHELRTPLTAILGWSQLLGELGPEDPNFAPALQTIQRNARSQGRLIEDLLDVSRIISGKMTLEREPLEAKVLLTQSLETVRPMTEARHQNVHLEIAAEPIYFRGDGTRISQVFWNILSNASKFTPEGGDIFVRLERAGHYFKLQVEDTGRGIASEFLPSLFDRFTQADGSYSRQHGGLGLGLAIVRHLVELHGGTVFAASEGVNRGATFTVLIPQNTTDEELDSAHRLSSGGEQNAGETRVSLSDVRILLVDDEPEALRLIKFALEKRGAKVRSANNVPEGFKLVGSWHPDVIVSDISMPGETGFDLIRRVRDLDHSSGGETPAIALTASTGPDARLQVLGAGFQMHIPKPLQPSTLFEGVRRLLDERACPAAVH